MSIEIDYSKNLFSALDYSKKDYYLKLRESLKKILFISDFIEEGFLFHWFDFFSFKMKLEWKSIQLIVFSYKPWEPYYFKYKNVAYKFVKKWFVADDAIYLIAKKLNYRMCKYSNELEKILNKLAI